MLKYGLLAMENEEQEKEAFHVCMFMHKVAYDSRQRIAETFGALHNEREHVYIYHIYRFSIMYTNIIGSHKLKVLAFPATAHSHLLARVPRVFGVRRIQLVHNWILI